MTQMNTVVSGNECGKELRIFPFGYCNRPANHPMDSLGHDRTNPRPARRSTAGKQDAEIGDLIRQAAVGTDITSFRKVAKAAGVRGCSNGWIYLPGASRPIARGWRTLASHMLDAKGFPWEARLRSALVKLT